MGDDITVLGGGVSGLSLADFASGERRRVTVVEAQAVFGGLVRTLRLGGQLFDIGPHGIYAPDPEIDAWFRGLLGDAMRPIERRSYTLFRGRRVVYPLTVGAALRAVGPLEAARVAFEAGILRPLKGPPPEGASFEQWATHAFGATLYRLFFRDYTRKVWGLPCDEMSAAWISAHLPANSLLQVLYDRLRASRLPIGFVSRFHYSAFGSGHLIDRLVARLAERDGMTLRPSTRVTALSREGASWRIRAIGPDGPLEWSSSRVVSTIPPAVLVRLLGDALPPETRNLADRLRFRNLVLTLLVVDAPRIGDANWLYVPDPRVTVSRISEFKNMIGSMADRPDTSLALETFCWPTDTVWSAPDEDVIADATREIEALGLIRRGQVKDATVVRVPHAYPVFDRAFESVVRGLEGALGRLPGLDVLGRTGAFLYLDQAGCVKRAREWVRAHCVDAA